MDKIKYLYLKFLLKIKNLSDSLKGKYNKSDIKPQSKVKMNSAAQLNFVSETEKIKAEVEELSQKIILKYKSDTDKTLEFIKKKNVKVCRTKFAVKLLGNIGEEQGFIPPLKGFKAFYINFVFGLICDKKLIFKTETEPVFIFNKNKVDMYYLSAQVYKWIAFRKKLSGFDCKVRDKFKKLYLKMTENDLNKLSADEIFAIKEAIAREEEASDFAMKIHSEYKQSGAN